MGNTLMAHDDAPQGNMFRMPRPAILAKGTPAVMEYLRGRVVQ